MKVFKSVLSLCLCVMMLMGMTASFGLSAYRVTEAPSAEGKVKGEYKYGDLTYNIVEDKVIIMYSPASGKVVIPDTIDGLKVTEIADYAFYQCKDIESITIGNNVWRVGDYAFDGCLNVGKLVIGSSVVEIGECAFRNCSFIDSLSLPKGIVRLGYDFIYGTDYYLRAKWTNDALYIDSYLIKVKSGLSGSYEIKAGTTCIADGAFRGCTSLSSVKIPGTVVTIGHFAFNGCTALTKVTVPNSVKYIHDYAFRDCSALTNVDLGNSVVEIGDLAFDGTKCLTKDGEMYYLDGYLISAEKEISGKVTVKEGTYGIAERAFWNRLSVTEIVLPSTLKSISSVAFSGTDALDKINIPASLKNVGGDAFKFGKKNLKVYIEDISAWCGIQFDNCDANPFRRKNSVLLDSQGKSVTEITVPAGVKSIGEYCFYNCDFLKKLTLPDSINSIGYGCFKECAGFTLVADEGSYAYEYAKAKGMSVTPACKHSFTNYVSNNDLSCTADGTATAKCDKGCGKTDTKVTAKALGHSFKEYVSNNDFSCTTDGTATAVCANGCGKRDTKVTDKAPGHLFGDWQVVIEPTYESFGLKKRICSVCGYEEKRQIPKPVTISGFEDLVTGAWYYDAIAFTVEKGYMKGMSETKFAPAGSITREQFVLILANMAGVDTDNYKETKTDFTDVKTGKWFSGAVAWAVGEGYVSGMSPTTFGTGQPIQRAALARLLYVYAEKNGIDTEGRADLSGFGDAAKVQSWMQEGICWAVEKGIISGMQVNGKLCLVPSGTATRAQTAVMLMKFEALK